MTADLFTLGVLSVAWFASGVAVGLVYTRNDAAIPAALEEGFRTFIEHHTEMDRDGDDADARWDYTVAYKIADETEDTSE